MTPLVEIKYGSHLFGTTTPASDLDLKGVHLPGRRDILLQGVKGVVTRSTKADQAARNTSGDVDFESFALQKYLALAAEGQTVALDMLFAPEWALTMRPTAAWAEIQANRHKLLSRQYQSFVGYCSAQANKYGLRGSRLASARAAKALLGEAMTRLGTGAKLGAIAAVVERASTDHPHMLVLDLPTLQGGAVRHWEVCERKMPYTASIKSAHAIMHRVVAEYGHRAVAAESNQGVDWKAISHAVRIARQAIELLETGAVTFPRPEAAHLLAIKTGQLAYRDVALEIDELLPRIQAAAERSSLPEKPDTAWIDDFVAEAYRRVVAGEG